jgi:hypothetical protein
MAAAELANTPKPRSQQTAPAARLIDVICSYVIVD